MLNYEDNKYPDWVKKKKKKKKMIQDRPLGAGGAAAPPAKFVLCYCISIMMINYVSFMRHVFFSFLS